MNLTDDKLISLISDMSAGNQISPRNWSLALEGNCVSAGKYHGERVLQELATLSLADLTLNEPY